MRLLLLASSRVRMQTAVLFLVGGQGLPVLLALFLRVDFAFWVVSGIPIAFAGGLIVMHWCGYTINLFSLFGFIVVMGIITDDAIVVGAGSGAVTVTVEPAATVNPFIVAVIVAVNEGKASIAARRKIARRWSKNARSSPAITALHFRGLKRLGVRPLVLITT